MFSHMFFQVSSLCCTEITQTAGIRLLSCMGSHVCLQMRLLGRSIRTIWAGKRLLPSVCSQVVLHVVYIRSGVRTNGATTNLESGGGGGGQIISIAILTSFGAVGAKFSSHDVGPTRAVRLHTQQNLLRIAQLILSSICIIV